MGKQGVLLEDRVDLPLMGRHVVDPRAVKEHVARGGLLKAADDAQHGGLAAPGGAQQREKFLIVDIQVNVVQNDVLVKPHHAIRQADQLLGHVSSPVSFGIMT